MAANPLATWMTIIGLAISVALHGQAADPVTAALRRGVFGDSAGVGKEFAVAKATYATPLWTVSSVSTTPPGPVMWLIFGADAQGRQLACWVTNDRTDYVYLDQGISLAGAREKVRAMGYTLADLPASLINPFHPQWVIRLYWDQQKTLNQPWAAVDWQTGEVKIYGQ